MFDSKHDIEPNRDGKPFQKNDGEFLPIAGCVKFFEFLKAKCRKGKTQKKCLDKNTKKINNCKKGINNWTEEKYRYKMLQVKKVFDLRKAKAKETAYPDIVSFVEVENAGVTSEIAKLLGYGANDHVTTRSYDGRGIDVAILYRPNENFKKVSHFVHPIKRVERDGGRNGRPGWPTRPILEVVFEYYGKPLHVFSNHWPALMAPTKLRNFAAEKLRQVIERRHTENPQAMFLAMGDFNTADLEKQAGEPHPFRDILLNGLYGLAPQMIDVKHEVIKKGLEVAPGSYYFDDNWQDLDRFFVSKNLLDRNSIDVDLSSFKIFNAEEISEPCNRKYCHINPRPLVPKRYSHRMTMKEMKENGQGFSDHYPIYVKIK